MYIYDHPEWPHFRLDLAQLTTCLAAVRHRQGRVAGRMQSLGFPLQQDANFQTLTEDVIKTSEIEGERLDRSQVRSSIARRLGIDIGGLRPVDRHVDGIGWHAAMFPGGYSGLHHGTGSIYLNRSAQ